jgi:Ser/Thr protein kinase RdoA (MazF antagonist)
MTWQARTATGAPFVLRRYRDDRGMDEVDYELAVVQHLDALGWPVPTPLEAPREIDGAVWIACRFLPGAPLERTPEAQRLLGRLIARLHIDLAMLDVVGQRPGWMRADDHFTATPTPEETFRAWASRRPAEAEVLLEFAERAREQLHEMRSDTYPSVLVHGDVTTWNVHYIDGTLTGLFDFEMVHLDLRVAEFAHTWRGIYEGFIEGFQEVTPLSEAEQMLIPPVRWAWLVGGAQHMMLRHEDPDLSWTMNQLDRRSPRMRL